MTPATQYFPIAHTWDGKPALEDEIVQVAVSRQDGMLAVEVDAPFHGDPAPPGTPASTDQLWNYEVVELFVAEAGPDEDPLRYIEIELSPHGHYLVLRLEGIRQVVARDLPLVYQARIKGARWRGRACVSLDSLSSGPYRGNACAIHGQKKKRRFLVHSALCQELRGCEPDFHRAEAFVPLRV